MRRNCPKCNKTLKYINKRCFMNAIERNKLCCICAKFGHTNIRKIFSIERECPNCNKKLLYSSAIGCYYANKKSSLCKTCSARNQMSIEKKQKMALGLKKRRKKYNWNIKISKIRRKNGTYIMSEEQKEKHRSIKIDKMIENKTLIWPNFNKNACKIFEKLEKDLKLNGFYATKNKEKRIGRFWVDYYEPNKNIIIEYDEKHHFDKNGNLKEKDIYRQKWIVNHTGCKFFRINESTKYEKIKHIILSNM